MRILTKSVVLLLLVVLTLSCYREPSFDLKPVIEYNKVTKLIRLDLFSGATKDSVIVILNFEDGDGDLGLSESEKTIAEATDDYNYIVTYFTKRNGVFEETEPLVTLSGYFPPLKLDDKEGPIDGVFHRSFDFLHAFTPINDTVKFAIQLKDRSGNLSNVVETEEVILNEVRL